MCKKVLLTRGIFTIIWQSDYDLLADYTCFALREYAYVRRLHSHAITQLGRILLGLDKGDKRLADHINGDSLDNRRCNLRPVNHTQNTINTKLFSNNKVGFRGVCKNKNKQAGVPSYDAQGRYKGKVVFLGSYQTPEAAHFMYCWFARQHYEGFSREGSLKFEEAAASIKFTEDCEETKIEVRFKTGSDISADVPKIVAAMTRLSLKCPVDHATTTA